MAHRPVADVGLGDGLHGDGGLDPDHHPQALQGVGQGQGIDDGGQHPHVVGPGAVHFAAGPSPPEVAAAHDDAHLDPQVDAFLDAGADIYHGIVVDPKAAFARQGFPADFQHDPMIVWSHKKTILCSGS